MLIGARLDRLWHHSRAHRFFAIARWSGDALGVVLADLIVARLLPAGAALTIAIDDTLFKRSGKKVFGAAWHHDGAAKGTKPIGFGNCWVVARIVVQLLDASVVRELLGGKTVGGSCSAGFVAAAGAGR